MSQFEKTVDGRKRRRSPAVDNEEDDDHEEISGCNRQNIQDFIDTGAEILEEEDARIHDEDNEEATNVEQQALLPSVGDPKLWAVKSAIGREREAVVHLMRKCIEKGHELQIRSAISLYHLKNYIYIEADNEVHVREAVRGVRNLHPRRVTLVPIEEMTDVLSVARKVIDVSRDTWVTMKTGTYKGDLAKVLDVDHLWRRVTVKLIPRIDLQALANKSEEREVTETNLIPPACLLNVNEARELHIRVEHIRDQATGDYRERIGDMMFKDGFLCKTVSMKLISTLNVQPTFDELEKFRHTVETGDGAASNLSTLFRIRNKSYFKNGDRVMVFTGEKKNLKGRVETIEGDQVHIKPDERGLPETLAFSQRVLSKYFEPGNHVKVVSGASEGATGIVVSVEGHVVSMVSDTTKDLLLAFSDNVVESSEVACGITRIGDCELHDLVLMVDNSFGVIISVENEAFQVLKGVPERLDLELVMLREIKYKIDKKHSAKDRYNSMLSVNDVVEILDDPFKGKQGLIQHIYQGILFIHDRRQLEHAGFICAKSESCMMIS